MLVADDHFFSFSRDDQAIFLDPYIFIAGDLDLVIRAIFFLNREWHSCIDQLDVLRFKVTRLNTGLGVKLNLLAFQHSYFFPVIVGDG